MNVGGVGRKFECPIGLTVDAHRTCLARREGGSGVGFPSWMLQVARVRENRNWPNVRSGQPDRGDAHMMSKLRGAISE